MSRANEPNTDEVMIEYSRKEALLNNLPGILTYALGSAILFHLWTIFGVLYVVFCVAGIVLFWGLICSHCTLYDRRCCPCGFGKISSRFFKEGGPSQFPRVFKIYVPIFALLWVLPLLGGIILLMKNPTLHYFLLLLSFSIIGFVLVPVLSRVHGCRDCPLKGKCPWTK